MAGQNISAITAATAVNLTDEIPLTQGSTGPNTGSTVIGTPQQIHNAQALLAAVPSAVGGSDVVTVLRSGVAYRSTALGVVNGGMPTSDASLATVLVPSASATTGFAARFKERLSLVSDFGAVPDAVLSSGSTPSWSGTDNGPAFQRAHNYAAAHGGIVIFVPNGHYLINSAVSITSPVVFEGVGFSESTSTAPQPGAGSWLCIGPNFVGSSTSPFTISGTAVNGSTGFRGFGISEAHPPDASGWVPNNYPAVFNITNTGGMVIFYEIYAFPVNKLFSFYNTARFDLDMIVGQVFTFGVFANLCEDACRIGRTHFWPFWNSSGINVAAWQQQNGDAVWVQRIDGLKIEYLFAIFYRSALRLDTSSSGGTNDAFIDALYGDACKYPLWITDDASGGFICTAQINQLYTGGETITGSSSPYVAGSTSIQVDGQCQLQIGSAKLYYCAIQAINFGNVNYGSIITIDSLYILNWNVSNVNAPAIYGAIVSGTAHELRLGQQPILSGGNGGPPANNPAELRITNAKLYFVVNSVGTGYTVGMNGWEDMIILVPTTAGTIATLNVTLPRYPYDGDEFAIYSEDNITTLNVSSYGGVYIVDCPGSSGTSTGATSLTAYQKRVFKFCVLIPGNPPRWFQIQ